MSAIECPSTGAPRVSVVVLAHRARDELRDCLAALAGQRTSHTFEVVLVLNGAFPDVAAFVDGDVNGVRIVRSRANRGFAGGCNLGVAAAGGEYLLFLNDDAVADATWIEELVTFADGHPGAGAVGGLVLFPDGSVQEAGGVVWREGNTAVVGRGGQADHPDVSYARRVDYASACALLVRRRAWDDVGGFDEDFFPAYYEDADLCLRLRDRGWEVWYTPAARVVHAESVTAGSAKADMFRASEATFLQKWSARLDDQVAHGGDPASRLAAAAARARGGGRRVLVIDELAPRPGMGAGYGRMLTVLEALLRRNTRVAFHASTDRGVGGLGRLGIEVVDDLDGFLGAPHNVLDAVIVSRPDNMALAERVREHQPWAALVYDAEALFSRRFEQWAAMADEEVERESAARRGRRYRAVEQSIAEHADAIVTISPEERDWFVTTGARCPVMLVPPVPDRATFTGAPFSERRGALFVASWLAGPQSPNAHGLQWFARRVLPRLRAQIPWVSVHVTGGSPPEQLSALASAALTFVGHVDDLANEYARARVAISPILWGAGVKLKTVEALAHGVPVVATTVGAEGIPDDWRHHVDVADDPAEFSALLVALLTDRVAWEQRRAGIADLLQHHRFDLGATWGNIIDMAVANRLCAARLSRGVDEESTGRAAPDGGTTAGIAGCSAELYSTHEAKRGRMTADASVGTAEFLQRVQSLGPWWFRFEIGGQTFGGDVRRDTAKTDLFIAWVERLGGGMGTVLELGSHEGSHTLQLASHPSVKRVVGLEGRPDNVARANFVKSVYGCDNAEFRLTNLESFEPSDWDGFDAVFCAGLLYHLPKPWELVQKMARVCRRYLFLDTHYAQDERVLVQRYAGRWYDENTVEPLSGLSNRSFWLSFKDLVLLLMESGFVIRFVGDDEGFPGGPRAHVIAERLEAVGSDWSTTQHGDWAGGAA